MATETSSETFAGGRETTGLFVDVHSHVIPSGDDGARSIEEGLELCRRAAAHGTRVLYGTPHAQPGGRWHSVTPERYRGAVANHEAMKDECAGFGLELRLGWEVAPTGIVGDVRDYVLEGLDAVLVEFPGPWFAFRDTLLETRRQVDEVRAAGLGVVLAHPERCVEIQDRPELVLPFAADGALVCFNADSFVGGHGKTTERCAWQLVELGVGDLLASDAHRRDRPSRLHEAVEVISNRYDPERALALADGSALGQLDQPVR
jgi:protein-tyrosine phosphatase